MYEFDFSRTLLKRIARFDRDDLITKLAGLALDPLYQENHIRIEFLTQCAIARARGSKQATTKDLSEMLNELLDHACGKNEDPAEDVFIGSITHVRHGDLLIILGNFIGSEFHLQRLIDAVESAVDEDEELMKPSLALLRLSDAVVRRCELRAGQFARGTLWRKDWPKSLSSLHERGRQCWFYPADLAALGIELADLEPFLLTEPHGLLDDRYGDNEIMARPLVPSGNAICLPIPALVSPAIRLHLVQLISARLELRTRVDDRLHLYMFGRWLIYDFPARRTFPMGNAEAALPEPDFKMFGSYAHAVLRFDDDKLMHLVCLGADWSDPPQHALHRTDKAPPNFTPHLNHHLRRCADILRQTTDRGMTIVIYDSPGWNIDFSPVEELGPQWPVSATHSSAWTQLLADPAFTLLDFWKMLREISEIKASGKGFGVYPDPVNYWAISKSLGGCFRIPGFDHDSSGGFASDTGAIQPWVAQTRAIRAPHGACDGNGEWERVERFIGPETFPAERDRPIYFQPLAVTGFHLRNVVEHDGLYWWVSTGRQPFSIEEKTYLFLLWQTATEWIRQLIAHPANPLKNDLPLFELFMLPVPESVPDCPGTFDYIIGEETPAAQLVVPANFVSRLATLGNEGEAELVDAIATAAIRASGKEIAAELRTAWVEAVTADPALKMMHVSYGPSAGMATDSVAMGARTRPLQHREMLEAARAARGLLDPEMIPKEAVIEGAAAIGPLLNAMVDARWQRCRARLAELDRAATLALLFELCEAVLSERESDERGALARTRLYVGTDHQDWNLGRISERDGSYHAFRIIAEMALCECPVADGRSPGLSDIDALAAEVHFLRANAEYSDAVRWGLLEGRLQFLADGALSPEGGGEVLAMPEYLRASLREIVDGNIDSYGDLFEEPGSHNVDLDDPFLAAFEAEFGIPMIDAIGTMLALQNRCLQGGRHVMVARRSELLAAPGDAEFDLTADIFDRFVSAFGLKTRARWDVPPKGFDTSDIWPWLFERRLSLLARPVFQIEGGDDPRLMFGVRQIAHAVEYVCHLLELGIWEKEKLRSEEARNWVTKAIGERSRTFEEEVCEIAEATGWRAFPSLSMRQLGGPKSLGQIDLLAVHEERQIWVLIECKWFGSARTAREVMNWMQDFHGRGGDKLDHHLRRYAWLRDNLELAAERLGIGPPCAMLGRIVTTRPVPLAFTKNLPKEATVLTRRQVRENLEEVARSTT